VKRILKFSSLLLAFFIFLSQGCNSGKKGSTMESEVIPREQMIRLMADMEITEAALKMKQVRNSRDSIKKIATISYDSLYISYRITPEQFKENLKLYQQDLEDYEAMVDEVIILLTQRKDSIANLPKDAPPDTLQPKKEPVVKANQPKPVIKKK